jgi:hypothetical protein
LGGGGAVVEFARGFLLQNPPSLIANHLKYYCTGWRLFGVSFVGCSQGQNSTCFHWCNNLFSKPHREVKTGVFNGRPLRGKIVLGQDENGGDPHALLGIPPFFALFFFCMGSPLDGLGSLSILNLTAVRFFEYCNHKAR